MDPATVLADLRHAMGETSIDLAKELPKDEDSDDEEHQSGGKSRLSDATNQILGAVHARRSQMLNSAGPGLGRTGGLPIGVYESVLLVQATTNEFLRHFWLAFLSGDEKRAGDITKLVATLGNSKARIEAIAETADKEKDGERVRKKREAQEEYRRTGVKPKRKSTEVGGGRKVVEEILGPTIAAVDKAINKYQSAMEEAEKMGAA